MNAENDMKKSRFTDAQILAVLKQSESGVPVADLCREHSIGKATYYDWRAKYGGMDASLMGEMKSMADENRRLKKTYAEKAMQNELLKDALGIEAASTPLVRVQGRT
jgi:putative transposase